MPDPKINCQTTCSIYTKNFILKQFHMVLPMELALQKSDQEGTMEESKRQLIEQTKRFWQARAGKRYWVKMPGRLLRI